MKKLTKTQVGILAGAGILTSLLLLYYESYKNNMFIIFSAGAVALLSWIAILNAFMPLSVLKEKKLFYKDGKLKWIKQQATDMALGLLFLSVSVGSGVGAMFYGQQRIDNILNDEPTRTAIATVTYITTIYGRYSRRSYYAAFEYTVGKDTIDGSKPEDLGDYVPGEEFTIKYSIAHPDMFHVMARYENPE